MSSIAHINADSTPPTVVPYTQYQQAMTRIQHLEHEVGQLRTELQWRDNLDRVPASTMSQNQKAALRGVVKAIQKAEPVAEGKYQGMVQIESWNLARKLGMSKNTFLDHVSYCADLGIIKKSTEKIRDPDTYQITATNLYVAPTELTAQPLRYRAEKDRNHGGDRHCKCGSNRLIKKVTRRVLIVCEDCGTVYSDEKTEETTMLNGNLDSQFDVTASAQTIESDPQGQFDYTAPEGVQNTELVTYNTQDQCNQLDVLALPEPSFPITPPPVFSSSEDATAYLIDWLQKRRGIDRKGNQGRMIFATGSVIPADKYKSKPVHYQPDIAAYLSGRLDHIYGSWLRRPDGLTYVLSFDLDKPEHHALHKELQEQLAAAGVPSIYWVRGMNGRERGHLEIYFDRPVDPDRARAWSIEMCPALAEVTECFPAGEKHSNALSWPLYQRIENQVQACTPIAQLCVGEAIQGDVTDRHQLAFLIQRSLVSAHQVEAFDPPISAEVETISLKRNEMCNANEQRTTSGGGLLESSVRTPLSDRDIVKLVIAEFNDSHSWEDVTFPWGGVENGRFRQGERGEKTASVVIDQDKQYACDYGDLGGRYPRKLDKYEVWIRANGVNKKMDLDERCREYRRREKIEQRSACTEARTFEQAKPKNSALAVPSSSHPVQEPSYDAMCDYIKNYGLDHGYPLLEVETEGQRIQIGGEAVAWNRFILMPVATKEQRIALYRYLTHHDIYDF